MFKPCNRCFDWSGCHRKSALTSFQSHKTDNINNVYTGVILNSLPVLSAEPVLRKGAVDLEIRSGLSSTDVDRRTASLNELQVHYFSVCLYIFGGSNRF